MARPKFLSSLDVVADGVGSRGVGSGAGVAAGAPASRGAIGDAGGASVSEATLGVGSLGASREYFLVQNTARRLASPAASLTWVTDVAHAPALQAQIEALELAIPSRLLTEPEARDSLAMIGLGVAVVEEMYGTMVVGSFVADHHLRNVPALARALCTVKAGAEAEKLTTIGIAPIEATTGYGYIEIGDKVPGNPGWHFVKRFYEKSDTIAVRACLETGRYLWNVGMFVFRTDMSFEALEREAPDAPVALRILAVAGETLEFEAQLVLWRQVSRAPVDMVSAEPLAYCGAVAVAPAPADTDWLDIGDWAVIYDLYAGITTDNTGDSADRIRQKTDIKPVGGSGTPAGQNSENVGNSGYPLANLTPETLATAVAAPRTLVRAPGLAGIAIVDIPGVVVIEEGGRLLMTTQEHAQGVKAANLVAEQWSGHDATD